MKNHLQLIVKYFKENKQNREVKLLLMIILTFTVMLVCNSTNG